MVYVPPLVLMKFVLNELCFFFVGGGGGLGYMKNISTFTCIYILNSKSKLIYRRSLIKNDDPEFYPTHIPTAFKDFVVTNLTREAAQITQCTSFSGATGGCDTSLFQISDIAWLNISGTQNTDVLASLQCSGAAPCTSVRLDVDSVQTNDTERKILCSNVQQPLGFECT